MNRSDDIDEHLLLIMTPFVCSVAHQDPHAFVDILTSPSFVRPSVKVSGAGRAES